MKNANLKQEVHDKYVSLHESNKNIEIYYKNTYNHSKIYCWLKGDEVIDVLAGSANFSVSGLTRDYQETLYDISKKDYSETLSYLETAIADSDPCDKHILKETKSSAASILKSSAANSLDQILSYNPPRAKLSLEVATALFRFWYKRWSKETRSS